ncbi:hypothetical protein [Chitinivorax sp. B]|uniref:hypothetical protein n=1 Tax=Chitinivorax sp. B TaxID=2502235 RepID=UPI0010F6D1EC|nr:hypothetical protein [Chitinivorax sp. B]
MSNVTTIVDDIINGSRHVTMSEILDIIAKAEGEGTLLSVDRLTSLLNKTTAVHNYLTPDSIAVLYSGKAPNPDDVANSFDMLKALRKADSKVVTVPGRQFDAAKLMYDDRFTEYFKAAVKKEGLDWGRGIPETGGIHWQPVLS